VLDDEGMNGNGVEWMGNDVFLKGVRVSDDVGVGNSDREGTGLPRVLGVGSPIGVLECVQVL
jgi:hypothetical protein